MDISTKNRYNMSRWESYFGFRGNNIWEVPHVKYDKSVYRSLVLITQFGINMLVPIFLCTIAGVYIGRKFAVEWITIPLFLVGALAGFRNVFIMAKRIYTADSTSSRSPVVHREQYKKQERSNSHAKKD